LKRHENHVLIQVTITDFTSIGASEETLVSVIGTFLLYLEFHVTKV